MSASKLHKYHNVDSSMIGGQGNNTYKITGGVGPGGKQVNIDYEGIRRKVRLLASNANVKLDEATPDVKNTYNDILGIYNNFGSYGNINSYPQLWNIVEEEFRGVGFTPLGTIGQLIAGCTGSAKADVGCSISCLTAAVKPPSLAPCPNKVLYFDANNNNPDILSNADSKKAIVYVRNNGKGQPLTSAQANKIRELGVTEVIVNNINADGTVIPYNTNMININNFSTCWYSSPWIWMLGIIVLIIIIVLIVALIWLALKSSRSKKEEIIE